jgi:plastocyanin
MNGNRKRGISIHLVLPVISIGVGAMLLGANPTWSLAANGLEPGSRSSVTGVVQAENGTALEGVVVTLEPIAGSSGAAHVPESSKRDETAVINRGGHFVPDLLVLQIGTRVTFRSVDRQFHTAELSSAGRLLTHLALLPDGPDFAYTFTSPGVVVMRDWMNPARDPAYVIIPETRHVDVSNGRGQFTIRDVPTGPYMLRAWHKDLGSRAFAVTVTDVSEAQIAFVLEAPKIAELSPARPSASTSPEQN